MPFEPYELPDSVVGDVSIEYRVDSFISKFMGCLMPESFRKVDTDQHGTFLGP
jgi:hypothetical protein